MLAIHLVFDCAIQHFLLRLLEIFLPILLPIFLQIKVRKGPGFQNKRQQKSRIIYTWGKKMMPVNRKAFDT